MILFFDTETTGLLDFSKPADDPAQPRIISLAAILVYDSGQPFEEYDRLVIPDGWTVPAAATAVNHITTEQCAESGISIAEVLDAMNGLIDSADSIAGYGIEFDLKMLRGEFRRAGLDDRYKAKPAFCVMRAMTPLCKIKPTMAMIMAAKKQNRRPGWKTPKLTEAVSILLGREQHGAHTAIGDVRATVELYFKFCNGRVMA